MPRKRWRRPPSYWDDSPDYERRRDVGHTLEDLELFREWIDFQADRVKKEIEEKKEKDKNHHLLHKHEWPKQTFGQTFMAVLFFGPIVAAIEFATIYYWVLKPIFKI